MRDDRERLFDIIEAVERIQQRAGIAKDEFERDELVQTWMVYNLQVIGEAASQLPAEFRSRHPHIPWRTMSAMRNALVHAYFRVDLDEVWNAIEKDIPGLKERIEAILEAESGHPGA